eukprot:3075650-Amphidinium_carterae.1
MPWQAQQQSRPHMFPLHLNELTPHVRIFQRSLSCSLWLDNLQHTQQKNSPEMVQIQQSN